MNTGVKSVWGKCNNVDVVYTKDDRGLWNVNVPAPENFIYVLEVWAEDYAGNRGYLATIRVTLNRDNLHISSFEIIKIGDTFSVEAVTEVFGKFVKSSDLKSEFISEGLNSSVTTSDLLRSDFK